MIVEERDFALEVNPEDLEFGIHSLEARRPKLTKALSEVARGYLDHGMEHSLPASSSFFQNRILWVTLIEIINLNRKNSGRSFNEDDRDRIMGLVEEWDNNFPQEHVPVARLLEDRVSGLDLREDSYLSRIALNYKVAIGSQERKKKAFAEMHQGKRDFVDDNDPSLWSNSMWSWQELDHLPSWRSSDNYSWQRQVRLARFSKWAFMERIRPVLEPDEIIVAGLTGDIPWVGRSQFAQEPKLVSVLKRFPVSPGKKVEAA